MQDVSLAGNRITRAIGALQEDRLDPAAAVTLLREAQRFILNELQKAQPGYESAVALRTERMLGGGTDSSYSEP
jgi:hypothetical protein